MRRLLHDLIRAVGGMLAPGYAPPSFGEAEAEGSMSTRDARRGARRALVVIALLIVGLVVVVQVLLGW
jgi:hypothetical protein